MYTYVQEELPALLLGQYGVGEVKSIFGHSMGGHGALTLAFKKPETWTSVSAFAPIANPTNCPWGDKAFKAYLGSVEAGKAHDATEILKAKGSAFPEFDDILVDQGLADQFLENQLKPEALEEAAAAVGQTLTVRRHESLGFKLSINVFDCRCQITVRIWKSLEVLIGRRLVTPATTNSVLLAN